MVVHELTHSNELLFRYYTSNVSGTMVHCNPSLPPEGGATHRTDPQATWAEWVGEYGNDKRSTLSNMPTDDELLQWARAKLGMTI